MDEGMAGELRKLVQADQQREAMKTIAGLMAAYRDDLMEQGWTRDEAFALCCAWQSELMETGRRQH